METSLVLRNERWVFRPDAADFVHYESRRAVPAAIFTEEATRESAEHWARLQSFLKSFIELAPIPERFRFTQSRPLRPALTSEDPRVLAQYEANVTAFERKREVVREKLLAFESARRMYSQGDLERYFEALLDLSGYPTELPGRRFFHYALEAQRLVVDVELPVPSDLPTLKKATYLARAAQVRLTEHPERAVRALYDGFVNQVALWAVDFVFRHDPEKRIGAVIFNGFIDTRDPATGGPLQGCILSVQVTRAEFVNLDLRLVDPRQCVRKLKGVAASSLYDLTPIPPLVQAPGADVRFIEGRAILSGISEGSNLAAMPWDDFEHLIREVFEREFASIGAEVKVTRGSRDGGVDAVIVDPDPIRGGKTIVQAKRYTHTVDVSAVRDLYGTVLNEGAGKGILVTTSDFGPDAHQFAKGKPLTLLNGGHLLFLLQKHGHKAHIDIAAARKVLGLAGST